MIEDVANDYAKYLKVDLQNEFHDVQDTIDDMLTRLDEFENLVNMVKTDNELCADISVPIVLHAKQKLDLLCDQIDALEKVVSCAKSDVDLIEMQVEEAEEVLSNQPSGKLKNILKPLFFFIRANHRRLSTKLDIIAQTRNVDSKSKLVYGGDLPNPTPYQSFGSLLYTRIMRMDRREEVFQICTETRKEMTTKNCLQRAVALAERLRERGVEKGDFIILFGNNSLNMNTALIGIFFLAAVPFPLTNKTSIEEFKIIIKYIKPKFYGCDKKHLYPFKKALLDISQYDTSRIFLLNEEEDPLEPDVEPFESFIKGYGTDFESFRPAEVTDPKEDLALLMKAMTDGTSGRVVGITHHNINSVVARYDAKDDGVKLRNRVILMVQKVMWMSGIYALLLSCCYGSKLIVMNEFDEVNFMKAVEDYKVTTTFLYSSKLWQLSKYNYPTKYDLSSLKYIYAIDGSIPKGLIDGMKEKTGLVLRPSYGLAEMTGLVLEPVGERKEGSTGKLVPQIIGKVVSDKTSQNLGPNERGELRFKGPTLSKGYINNVKSNRMLFDNEGFLLSGHYGYYDEEGDFFIIDKIFHVIKYKDYKLSPRELEGIIKSLETVRDVCVTGIQHPTEGYYPIAFVVLQKGRKISEKLIIKHVNDNVPDYKRLRGGVVFVSKIPRFRDSGSIKRALFKKIMSKYRLKPGPELENILETEKPDKELDKTK